MQEGFLQRQINTDLFHGNTGHLDENGSFVDNLALAFGGAVSIKHEFSGPRRS